MISKFLNKPVTWIVTPGLLMAMVYVAGLKSLNPIPQDEANQFLHKFYELAPAETWQSRLHNNRIQGARPVDVYARNLFFSSSAPAELLTELHKLAPEYTSSRDKLLTEQIAKTTTTSQVETVLYNSLRDDQGMHYLLSRARLDAEKGMSPGEMVQNLTEVFNRYEMTYNHRIGYNYELTYLYNQLYPLVEFTNDSPTLLAMASYLRTTENLLSTTSLISNPYIIDRFARSIDYLQTLQVSNAIVTRANILIANYQPNTFFNYSDNEIPSPRSASSFSPFPLTSSRFELRRAIKEFEALKPQWSQFVPNLDLSGLSPVEQLYATILLLETPPAIHRKYAYQRLAATQREIIRAAIFTKLFQMKNGELPVSIEQLKEVGFLPPASSQSAYYNPRTPELNRLDSHGPLNLERKFRPDTDDFRRLLDLKSDDRLDLEELGLDSNTSMSKWRVKISRRNGTNLPFNEALLAKSLENRPGLNVTSWTLFYTTNPQLMNVEGDITSPEIHWKPTDMELLQDVAYAEINRPDSIAQVNRTPGVRKRAYGLPDPKQLTRPCDGLIIEINIPTQFCKISPPPVGNRLQNYDNMITYIMN